MIEEKKSGESNKQRRRCCSIFYCPHSNATKVNERRLTYRRGGRR